MLGLALSSQVAIGQTEQIWIAGAGGGVAFGVNEDRSRPLVPLERIEAVAFNSVVPGVSPEFGIGYSVLRSDNTGNAFDYKTQLIVPDLRFRFSPLTTPEWFPYIYLGGGIVIYNVLEVPRAASGEARLSDAAPFFTCGAGLSHQLFEKIGIDLNFGPSFSMTDDINPVHDGKNDGWWTGLLSVYWIF